MQNRHTNLSRRTLCALTALVVAPLSTDLVNGQDLAGQERIRRQLNAQKSQELLIEGREAYQKGDFKTAYSRYSEALRILPHGTATAKQRKVLQQHLNDGALAYSQRMRRTGQYEESREILTNLQKEDPGNQTARRGLEYMDDPIRTNPSLTYDHTKNIDRVRRHLYKGEGFYDLGLYDKADEEFKKVLRIDPYNKAARRWMERVNRIKSNYYRAAYDQTRAQMLMEVDRAWELAVPPVTVGAGTFEPIRAENAGERGIAAKLDQITIDLELSQNTVEEAIEIIRVKAKESDDLSEDLTKRGINLNLLQPKVVSGEDGGELDADIELEEGDVGELDGEAGEGGDRTLITLKLTDVPLRFALQQVCDQAGLRYKVDEFGVTVIPRGSDREDSIVQRQWTVPPTFYTFLAGGGGGGGGIGDVDPFPDGDEEENRFAAREDIKTLLQKQGVTFGPKATASFLAPSSRLIVQNTPTQLELIDGIVKASFNDTPRQIRVTAKFVEVSQENGEELGFDWIITPYGLGNNVFAGGGTVGNGPARTSNDFINPVNFTSIPGIPVDPSQNVSNIVTGGNRSGASAIGRNSIDAILNNPQRAAQSQRVAPGILSLTGLFTKGQIQMVMRGLSQKKGTDVLTAPSVVALPSTPTTIEIIREFIYPTDYEPPQLPNNVGGGGGGGIFGGGGGGFGQGGGAGFPVTPATPTAFETKNTGVTLEVTASIAENSSIIELDFQPTIVEFEGFINYGSPITAPTTDALGNPTQIVITDNRIEMPVFSVRRVRSRLRIFDGYTVAVGGLMREDVQSVEDKVPLLGDLPFIGRLFQTKAQHHIKSNLIIFVTPEIIDATGQNVTNELADSGTDIPTDLLDPDLPGAGGSVLPGAPEPFE